MVKKRWFFGSKSTFFYHFFTFSQRVLTTIAMFTTLVIQHWRLRETYLDSSHPKRFYHTTNSACFGGWKRTYFFPITTWWKNHIQLCMLFTFNQEFSIPSEISDWNWTSNFLRVTRKWHSNAHVLCLGHQVTKQIRIWAKNEKFCTFEARIFEYDRNFCRGWKLEFSIYDPQVSLAFLDHN